MSRKQIRNAFNNAAKGVYSGDIYETRLSDFRDISESVSIYFTGGEVQNFVSFEETQAEIIIEFFKQGATDDVLDEVADQIKEAVLVNDDIDTELTQILYTGFEYETQENGQNSIKLKFNIMY